jgi:uncharacterized protein (UPF0333 family)
MNLYPILAGVLLFVASITGAYFKGRHDQKADVAIIQQVANNAAAGAVADLKESLQPKVTNLYRTTTVLNPECIMPQETWDALMEIYHAK